jgi:hypothetical protein
MIHGVGHDVQPFSRVMRQRRSVMHWSTRFLGVAGLAAAIAFGTPVAAAASTGQTVPTAHVKPGSEWTLYAPTLIAERCTVATFYTPHQWGDNIGDLGSWYSSVHGAVVSLKVTMAGGPTPFHLPLGLIFTGYYKQSKGIYTGRYNSRTWGRLVPGARACGPG